HHEDEGLDEAARILRPDRARVQHVGVTARHRLELARHYPLTGDLEVIVLAAQVLVEAVFVAAIHVAGAEPGADEGPPRLVEALVVAHRHRRRSDPEHPLLTVGDHITGGIAQLRLRTRHGYSRRPGAALTR